MALKPDERAMLQLLLEREQSYADIASLLGGTEAETRQRAHRVLADLGGADPDTEAPVSDYLLGQADPIDRADVVRHLQRDPAAAELAAKIAVQLQAVAPGAELPEINPSGSRSGRSVVHPAATTAESEPGTSSFEPKPPRTSLSPEQSRMMVIISSLAVIAVALVIVLVFGGDEGSDDATAAPESAATSERLTQVDLKPVGSDGAVGRATFGLTDTDTLFLDLSLQGLKTPADDQGYILWLLLTDGAGYPLTPILPDRNGNYSDRLVVPTAVAALVAPQARFVDISLAEAGPLDELIQQAIDENQPTIPYTGQSVSRGRIPIDEQAVADAQAEAGSGDTGSGSASGG